MPADPGLNIRTLRGAQSGALGAVVMALLMVVGVVTPTSPVPTPVPLAVVSSIAAPLAVPLQVGLALLAHLGYGAWWGAILARWQGRPDWIPCLAISAFLWLIMGLVLLPPLGWGVMGIAQGPLVPVTTLALHMAYGAATRAFLWRSWSPSHLSPTSS